MAAAEDDEVITDFDVRRFLSRISQTSAPLASLPFEWTSNLPVLASLGDIARLTIEVST